MPKNDDSTKKPNRKRKQNKRKSWRKQRARTLHKEKEVRNKFERSLKDQLENAGIGYLYEGFKVTYVLEKTYLPDFAIKHNNIIIEAKGVFDADDRRKHLAIKEQHPELDIRFVFVRDNKLRRGAKTTYSEWCNHHGFKYAFGEIPKEWLDELPDDTTTLLKDRIESSGGKLEQRSYFKREQDSEPSDGEAGREPGEA